MFGAVGKAVKKVGGMVGKQVKANAGPGVRAGLDAFKSWKDKKDAKEKLNTPGNIQTGSSLPPLSAAPKRSFGGGDLFKTNF